MNSPLDLQRWHREVVPKRRFTFRNFPEEGSSILHRGGSLKSGNFGIFYLTTHLIHKIIQHQIRSKGKAVPLQAWSGPEGSRKLKFPDFVSTAQDGGRLSALRTGRLYPQEMLLLSVRGWVDPRARKDFMSMKNPMTLAGIKPATLRFVAQHLNHCATAVPIKYEDASE